MNGKTVVRLWCLIVLLALVACKGEKAAEPPVQGEEKNSAAKSLPTKSPGELLVGEWVQPGWFVEDSGVFMVQAFNSDGELTIYVKTKESKNKPAEGDDDWAMDFDDYDFSTAGSSPSPLPMYYSLDASSTPHKLDMFVKDSGKRVGTSKAILEFVTEDEIRIRTFDAPERRWNRTGATARPCAWRLSVCTSETSGERESRLL